MSLVAAADNRGAQGGKKLLLMRGMLSVEKRIYSFL